MLDYLFYTSVYFLLVFLIYLFHVANKNDEKKFVFLSFMLLFVFAAISYDVGWDYMPYYQNLTFDMSFDRYERIEYLFAVFSRNINYPQFFFIINHFIIVLLMMMSIYKESKNPYLSVIAFLCFPLFYLGGLSVIRFSAALSIVIFGYVYFMKEGKVVLFLVTIGIAYLFHAAILAAALLIPLHYLKVSRTLNVIALVVSFVLSQVFMSWFSSYEGLSVFGNEYDRLSWYMGSGDVGGQSKLHYFFLMLNIFNLIEYHKLKDIDENNVKYITFFNVGCCLAFLFSSNTVFMSRFSKVYYFFIIFLIPYYYRLFPKYSQRVVNRMIVFMAILLFAIQLALPNYNGMEPGRTSTYWPYRVYFMQHLNF